MEIVVQDGGGLSASATIAVNVVDGPEPELPQPPMFISDINGLNGTAFIGTVALDEMGVLLGHLGDVNGDGFFDYSIGSPYAEVNGSTGIGQCNFVFGGPNQLPATLPLEDALFDGEFGIIITGDDFAENRLRQCEGLGDINGDGIHDFVVNENGYEIYVYYGRPGPWAPISIRELYPMNEPDGTVGTMFRPGSVATGFVHTGAGPVGDFDGDGLNDLGFRFQGIFTSQSYDTIEAVLYGPEGGFPGGVHQADLFDALSPLDGLWIDGNEPALDRISGPLFAGDFNGDGFDDVMLAGMWGDPNGITNAGHVYVVFGQPDRVTSDIFLPGLDGVDGVIIEGFIEWEQIGLGGIASIGDVNGDGYDDIAIGAYRSDAVFPDGGRAYVVFGRADFPSGKIALSELDGLDGFAINPTGHVDYLGYALDGAGDVNGDGYDDIIVGAPQAYDPVSGGLGQAYVIFGGQTGRFPATLSVSSLDGITGFTFTGLPEVFHGFGGVVRGVGDTDGDGFDDLLVADAGADPGGLENAGEICLVLGNNFTGAVTNAGGDGDDVLAGSSLDDVMIGGAGSDALLGGVGSDVLKGAQGDDVLAIAGLSFRQVDGGSGTDTLRLDAGGLVLNLTVTRKNRLRNLEIVDLTGTGDNAIVLDRTSVANLSDETNTLKILGDTGDVAAIGSGWTLQSPITEGGVTYQVYSWGQTQTLLLIEETVNVSEL